ncbi:MAG: alkaline phosphatase, partial [Acidobacteria bacterium]|nr:alkaline phosphatase [Acidobacteriota bacterium]
MRRVGFPILFAGSLLALVAVNWSALGPSSDHEVRPKSVVLLIGDGLGSSQTAFARYLTLGRSGRFAFEGLPVTGLVSTYSA